MLLSKVSFQDNTSKDVLNTHFSKILTPTDSKINKLSCSASACSWRSPNTGRTLHTPDVSVLFLLSKKLSVIQRFRNYLKRGMFFIYTFSILIFISVKVLVTLSFHYFLCIFIVCINLYIRFSFLSLNRTSTLIVFIIILNLFLFCIFSVFFLILVQI